MNPGESGSMTVVEPVNEKYRMMELQKTAPAAMVYVKITAFIV